MDTNNRPLEDLAVMFTNQLQQDKKHEHKMRFVQWVGKRVEYQCSVCEYTYLANH